MLRRCFCGCERKVRRTQFVRYGVNVAGRDSTRALAQLDAAQALIEAREPPPGESPVDFVAKFITPKREMGQYWTQRLQDVVHGESEPFHLREFKAWLKEARGMTTFMLASRDDQLRIKRLAEH